MRYFEGYKKLSNRQSARTTRRTSKPCSHTLTKDKTITFPEPGATIIRYCDWAPGAPLLCIGMKPSISGLSFRAK